MIMKTLLMDLFGGCCQTSVIGYDSALLSPASNQEIQVWEGKASWSKVG
jgi:hypothetical protein